MRRHGNGVKDRRTDEGVEKKDESEPWRRRRAMVISMERAREDNAQAGWPLQKPRVSDLQKEEKPPTRTQSYLHAETAPWRTRKPPPKQSQER